MKLNKYLNESISDTEYGRLWNKLSNKTRKAINEFDFETDLEDYQIKMLHDIIDLVYQDGYDKMIDDKKSIIIEFFNEMVIEFSGVDDGHSTTLDDRTVNGLKNFMKYYIGRLK